MYRFHALLRDFLRASSSGGGHASSRCSTAAAPAGTGRTATRTMRSTTRWPVEWDFADDLASEAWHIVVMGVDARPWNGDARIPPDACNGRPGLAFRAAAEMLAMGDRISAEASFDAAVEQLESLAPEKRALLAPVVESFHIVFATLDGDFTRVRDHAAAMADLPRAGTFQVGRRMGAQRRWRRSASGAQLAAGDLDQAELSLEEGLGRAHDVGLDVVALNCLSELALVEVARGSSAARGRVRSRRSSTRAAAAGSTSITSPARGLHSRGRTSTGTSCRPESVTRRTLPVWQRTGEIAREPSARP